jgi:hypothetical protein
MCLKLCDTAVAQTSVICSCSVVLGYNTVAKSERLEIDIISAYKMAIS